MRQTHMQTHTQEEREREREMSFCRIKEAAMEGFETGIRWWFVRWSVSFVDSVIIQLNIRHIWAKLRFHPLKPGWVHMCSLVYLFHERVHIQYVSKNELTECSDPLPLPLKGATQPITENISLQACTKCTEKHLLWHRWTRVHAAMLGNVRTHTHS